MSKNTGHNWRSPSDGEYDRLVDLAAMAMIDRAAEIYLSELRGKFPSEGLAALEREVNMIWRAAFDQMMQAFPLKN